MKVLILSQAISEGYVAILKAALPEECKIDIITGSKLKHYSYIEAPAHNPNSLKSRLRSWYQYYRFVTRWAKANTDKRYDFIFATSNPPINSYLGVQLKKKLRSRFIYMNWDLYPQVIENIMSGFIPATLSRVWHFMNGRIYPKIDQMLTIGEVMGETINERFDKKLPVQIVPMFTDIQRLKPLEKKENQFCIDNGLSDKFIVLYSGKMGLGHNLEVLLESSRKLRKYEDILFLFIGHGQKYEMVETWIKEENPPNVKLLPLQPPDVFPLSMASGDIGFISQEKSAAKCFMPCKTYDMMACGMAILAYSEGRDDLSRLIGKYEMGIVITKNDPDIFAREIERLYLNRDLVKRYGNNARSACEQEFDKECLVKKYRNIFNGLDGNCVNQRFIGLINIG